MKRFTGIIGSLLFFLFSVSPVFAATEHNVTLPSESVVTGNYITAGSTVRVSGTVQGDSYVAGGDVTVDGTIDGDMVVAGGTVSVTGKISQNLRVMGGNVEISGTVGRNVSVAGGSVTITQTAKIGGSVVGAGGEIVINAPVQKELDVAGGQVMIGNTVTGDVRAAVGQLTLAPGASISGSLTYWSRKDAEIQPGANVAGPVVHNVPPGAPNGSEQFFRSVSITAKILGFLSALVIGLLMLYLFPNFSKNTAALVLKRPWAALGWGFLVTILLFYAFFPRELIRSH